jgi:anti-anti-sigma factor
MTKQTMSISRAFGKVVLTVHGDVDAEFLRRTLTDLAQDQSDLHLIIDLRDAGLLDQDSVSVLVGSAQRVRRAGGELVLTTPSLAVHNALEGSGFTIAESGKGVFHGGEGGLPFRLPSL